MTDRPRAYWYVEENWNGRTHAKLLHDPQLSWPGQMFGIKRETAYTRVIGLVEEQQFWSLDECREFFNM